MNSDVYVFEEIYKDIGLFVSEHKGKVVVVGYIPEGEAKYVKGRLVGLTDGFLVIQSNKKLRSIALDKIVEIKIEI